MWKSLWPPSQSVSGQQSLTISKWKGKGPLRVKLKAFTTLESLAIINILWQLAFIFVTKIMLKKSNQFNVKLIFFDFIKAAVYKFY